MSDRQLLVRAEWDPDASVWVATSDDVPGLVTEASSLDELIPKLKVMIPEMLDENGFADDSDDVPFVVQSTLAAVAHRCIS